MGNKFVVDLSRESTKELVSVLGAKKQKPPASSQDPFGIAIDLLAAVVSALTHRSLAGLEKVIRHYVLLILRDKQREQLKLQVA